MIGGGVIGGGVRVNTDFGVRTTLLEAPHGVLPVGPDRDTADVLAKALAKRGTDIHAEARVGAVEATSNGVLVPFETPAGSGRSRSTRFSSSGAVRSARGWVWTAPA